MSLLARLKQKEKECILEKEKALTLKNLVEIDCIDEGANLSQKSNEEEEGEWMSCRTAADAVKSSIAQNIDKLCWNTQLKTGVDSYRLIWAPYFFIKDRLFCGLLRDKKDILGQDMAEVQHGEVVVELFHMSKQGKCQKTKFLIVPENKIKSYFGAERDMNYPIDSKKGFRETPFEDKTHWNVGLMGRMYNSLVEKHNISNGEEIYRRIENTAKSYLIQVAKDRRRMEEQRSMEVEEIDDTPPDEEADLRPKFDILSVAPTARANKVAQTLAVGDWISWSHKLLKDVVMTAKITAFTHDDHRPFLLSNDETVNDSDRVQKCLTYIEENKRQQQQQQQQQQTEQFGDDDGGYFGGDLATSAAGVKRSASIDLTRQRSAVSIDCADNEVVFYEDASGVRRPRGGEFLFVREFKRLDGTGRVVYSPPVTVSPPVGNKNNANASNASSKINANNTSSASKKKTTAFDTLSAGSSTRSGRSDRSAIRIGFTTQPMSTTTTPTSSRSTRHNTMCMDLSQESQTSSNSSEQYQGVAQKMGSSLITMSSDMLSVDSAVSATAGSASKIGKKEPPAVTTTPVTRSGFGLLSKLNDKQREIENKPQSDKAATSAAGLDDSKSTTFSTTDSELDVAPAAAPTSVSSSAKKKRQSPASSGKVAAQEEDFAMDVEDGNFFDGSADFPPLSNSGSAKKARKDSVGSADFLSPAKSGRLTRTTAGVGNISSSSSSSSSVNFSSSSSSSGGSAAKRSRK